MRPDNAAFAAGALALLLLVIAGCSSEPGGPATGSAEPTAGSGKTARSTTAEEVVVEQIGGGQSGPARQQVIVAGSARELSEAAGVEVPDAGEGVYVSAHAGERPTGGYRVSVSGTGSGGVRVTLREPDEGDIVTQALTQPYAVAVVRSGSGDPPDAGELRFVDRAGEPLSWPVRVAGEG